MNCKTTDFLVKWLPPEHWPFWLRRKVDAHRGECPRCAAGFEPVEPDVLSLLREDMDETLRRHESRVPADASRRHIERRIERLRRSFPHRMGWRPWAWPPGARLTPALGGAMVVLLAVGSWMLMQHAMRGSSPPLEVTLLDRTSREAQIRAEAPAPPERWDGAVPPSAEPREEKLRIAALAESPAFAAQEETLARLQEKAKSPMPAAKESAPDAAIARQNQATMVLGKAPPAQAGTASFNEDFLSNTANIGKDIQAVLAKTPGVTLSTEGEIIASGARKYESETRVGNATVSSVSAASDTVENIQVTASGRDGAERQTPSIAILYAFVDGEEAHLRHCSTHDENDFAVWLEAPASGNGGEKP
jgi:hypothetical protein